MSTRIYVIVRDKLTGGALLSYAVHAAREAPGPSPCDENATVLIASKDQLESAQIALQDMGIPSMAYRETDGKMAGALTSLGFAIEEEQRGALPAEVQTLRPWSPARAAEAQKEACQ